MTKAALLIGCGILLLPLSVLADYDDWKAPLPIIETPAKKAEVVDPIVETPPHYLFVNEVVEQEQLPYISIKGYNLKIAINPAVLEKYNLKSGDLVTSEQMYEIIDADRDFQKGILK